MQDFQPIRADVRSGSVSTELGRPRHVRFTPYSNRIADIPDWQLRAMNGPGDPNAPRLFTTRSCHWRASAPAIRSKPAALVFQATPKSHQDDTVFRSAVAGGYSLVGRSIKPAKPKPARPNVARFIDLMFPIPFKSLLKYLRRCSLVNFSKLLERKRVGHTQNIGINGLQGQHLARLQLMN